MLVVRTRLAMLIWSKLDIPAETILARTDTPAIATFAMSSSISSSLSMSEALTSSTFKLLVSDVSNTPLQTSFSTDLAGETSTSSSTSESSTITSTTHTGFQKAGWALRIVLHSPSGENLSQWSPPSDRLCLPPPRCSFAGCPANWPNGAGTRPPSAEPTSPEVKLATVSVCVPGKAK